MRKLSNTNALKWAGTQRRCQNVAQSGGMQRGSYLPMSKCLHPTKGRAPPPVWRSDLGNGYRGASDAELASLTTPLLPDVENVHSSSNGKQKPEGSWYSALGHSIAYVWPKTLLLQLRATTCIVLVLVIRVLNLVVPVCYGKMVDALAAASADHAKQPPVLHPFKTVFIPWVFAYLVARFLQGGGMLPVFAGCPADSRLIFLQIFGALSAGLLLDILLRAVVHKTPRLCTSSRRRSCSERVSLLSLHSLSFSRPLVGDESQHIAG
jgi:hypothetical protein